jgi:hypothetical protein
MVLGKFFGAVLPQLTTAQRKETRRDAQVGHQGNQVADGELTLPVEYHTALLDFANAIVVTLARYRPGIN